MTENEKYLARTFRKWVKRQPKKNFIVVTEHDLERCQMAELRDCLGYSSTSYFTTLGVTEQI